MPLIRRVKYKSHSAVDWDIPIAFWKDPVARMDDLWGCVLQKDSPFRHCANLVKIILQDRVYFVSIGNHESEETKISCGVPQGTIFGASSI